MQILINIPDEQIKKSLEESKYAHEDEGEKSSVHIEMLYTNGQLDFVDVSRKTDFYSCKYKVLPKDHGRLIDADELLKMTKSYKSELGRLRADPFVKSGVETIENFIKEMTTIIGADRSEKNG